MAAQVMTLFNNLLLSRLNGMKRVLTLKKQIMKLVEISIMVNLLRSFNDNSYI